MFRVISIISFFLIIVTVFYLNRVVGLKSGGVLTGSLADIRKTWFGDLTLVSKKLVYVLAVISFIILILTGFAPVLFTGNSVSGILLMLHVLAAVVFAVCMAIVSVMWSHHHRFESSELRSLLNLISGKKTDKNWKKQINVIGQKASFWLIVLLCLTAILSIILSMYPLFGTRGQEVLLHLHGYSALLLVIAVVMSFYLLKLIRKTDTDKKSKATTQQQR